MQRRREHTRVPIQLKVRVGNEHAGWETLSRDISAGGILVEWSAEDAPEPGTLLYVQVMEPRNSPMVPVRVVRVTPDSMALSFLGEDAGIGPDAWLPEL